MVFDFVLRAVVGGLIFWELLFPGFGVLWQFCLWICLWFWDGGLCSFAVLGIWCLWCSVGLVQYSFLRYVIWVAVGLVIVGCRFWSWFLFGWGGFGVLFLWVFRVAGGGFF